MIFLPNLFNHVTIPHLNSQGPALVTHRAANSVQAMYADAPSSQLHTGLAPSYLRECVTASADVTSRPRLRSTSSQRYQRPRTRLKFGERSFSCAGPRAWNGLPSSLQELTDNKTFKRKLKTFLFQQAYN